MSFEAFKHVCYMQYMYVGQRATKLPVLFQSYLLQVMYMTFQYLTVSAIGYVPNHVISGTTSYRCKLSSIHM